MIKNESRHGCWDCKNRFKFSDEHPCNLCFQSWWMNKDIPEFWEEIKEMIDKYKPGLKCKINSAGDLFFIDDAKKFIGQTCIIIKRTRAGLIQVCLESDHRQKISLPQKNVDITSTTTP